MDSQPLPKNDSIGNGLFGCASGILLGFLGGGVLLILVSLVWAVTAADPTPLTPASSPDLRVTIGEAFLNRMAQQRANSAVTIDLLPANQISLSANTTITALGVSVPVNLRGLFGIQVSNQAVEVRLIETQVTGLEVQLDLGNFFSGDIAQINQELTQALNNLSTLAGVPIRPTGLGTTDQEIWLEAGEAP
jgi:hypothetical protein